MSEDKNEIKKEKKYIKNVWKSVSIAFIILSVILFGIVLSGFISPRESGTISADMAAEKVLTFIRENMVSSGTEVSVKEIVEEGGLYKMGIKVSYGNQTQNVETYITKDGKIFFPQAINIDEFEEAAKAAEQEEKQTSTFDAPDAEKSNVKFFVMSFCPYGNQAESGLEPVFRLLGDKVDWEPHYVIYSNYGSGYPNYCLDEENKYCSMHGIQELNQDVRELCAWKYESPDMWWSFVSQVNKNCSSQNVDTCWEPIAEELGMDVNKIKTCQKDEAEELLQKEVEIGEEFEVRGSPSVFINDKSYSGGRDPESYKNAICSGFITPPEECKQTLSATGSTTSGGCG